MLSYSTILLLVLSLYVIEINGLTVQNVTVPYAKTFIFNCTGATAWYYKDDKGADHQITSNDTFTAGTDSLTIKETRKDQLVVTYYCNSTSPTSTTGIQFNVYAEPYMYVLEKSSVTVTEGGSATATCKLIVGFSNQPVEWRWIGPSGTDVNLTDTRISFTSGNSSTLTIKSVVDADKGTYVCLARNYVGSYNSTITLRVKSTLAALWPFLAIVGEVIILCIIILIFEKKCGKKSSSDANKEEQNANLLKKDTENSDVKKRAVKA